MNGEGDAGHLCLDMQPCVCYYKIKATEVFSNCFSSLPPEGLAPTWLYIYIR